MRFIKGSAFAVAVSMALGSASVLQAQDGVETKTDAAGVAAEEPAAAAPVREAGPDDALLEELTISEQLRRETLDKQALNEIERARAAMNGRDYDEAFRLYELASKHLNDRVETAELRDECRDKMAEAKYLGGKRAIHEGNREAAIKYFEDAQKLHHPQAGAQLAWLKENQTQDGEKDNSDISHRINEKDYKAMRDQFRRHLRRSRQYFATAEYYKALEECELVLRQQPHNEEAISLREQIAQRMRRVENHEFLTTREEMMHQVRAAWRPVYAAESAQLDAIDGSTVRRPINSDPERTQEQSIEKRMKEMRLPSVSFRPPATLVDAVEYFRQASKDFDRPDIPAEQRGINFVLRVAGALTGGAQAAQDAGSDDAFGASAETEDASAAAAGPVPQIPAITASDISLWEALYQVCQVTGYKFQISGSFVIVMPKDATIEDFITRSYTVLDLFAEKVNNASTDIKSSRSTFGSSPNVLEASEGGSQERDWKQFFEEMGVKWPPNSTISYIKSIGKLRVTNTADNLAVFEQVLSELNVTPTLIEIETRFVEVSQEDLNSLGFEWLLNSNYSLNLGHRLGKALGVKHGSWTEVLSGGTTTGTSSEINTGGVITKTTTTTTEGQTVNTAWKRGKRGIRNLGVTAFGGTSEYQNGNRYLSTVGNPISGQGESTNDQFMRINGFLGNADLSLILHMLSQRSDTDLLCAPKVVTKSGQQAVIKVVTEYIYPQDYDVTIESSGSNNNGGGGWGGGGGGAILAMVEPQNFTMREVGVILDVTPTLLTEGNIIELELKPAVIDEPVWHDYGMKVPILGNQQSLLSSLSMTLTSAADLQSLSDLLTEQKEQEYYTVPMEQPFFHVRSIDTKLSIYNGATVVMGGLITEERKSMDDKVPFLGDIPFIGRLFRSRSEWSNKRNLLLFVTARLVDPSGRAANVGNGDNLGNAGAAQQASAVTAAPAE